MHELVSLNMRPQAEVNDNHKNHHHDKDYDHNYLLRVFLFAGIYFEVIFDKGKLIIHSEVF